MARLSASMAAAAAAAGMFRSAAAQTVHRVNVGQGGLRYEPAEVTAARGDTVEFHFLGGFHSVARSSFDSPCTPINGSDDNIFSGPVTGPSDDVFTVTIEDDDPIWFYCATQRHCQSGMVGVINAPSSGGDTLESYRSAAAGVSMNVAPSATGGGTLGPAPTGSAAAESSSSAAAATGSGSATGSATGSAAGSATGSASESGSASETSSGAGASSTAGGGSAGASLRSDMGMVVGSVGVAMAAFVAGLML